MITTVCKISYGSQTVPPIVPAVQGDTGRAISFEIADFTPPAGATATYFILKPSGEAIYNSATITDNSILCELTAQSLAEAGENRMQVRVLQGENIVTSFEVILMVRTFLGDDAIESGTEMNIFDQAVEQATEQFQENAEQIVAEVIESIPSDYTELTEEVDELNDILDTCFDKAFQTKNISSMDGVVKLAGYSFGTAGSTLVSGSPTETYDSYYFYTDADTAIYFASAAPTSPAYVALTAGYNPSKNWVTAGGQMQMSCTGATRKRKSENNLPVSDAPMDVSDAIVIVTVNANTDISFSINDKLSLSGEIAFPLEQTTGQSVDKAMSQKAITDAIVNATGSGYLRYVSGTGGGYSTERVEVFLPIKSGYIKYNFVHSVNTDRNADIWRVDRATIVSNSFQAIRNITADGEWECAVRISERDDFSGGVIHGDEIKTGIVWIVDGSPVDISTYTDYTQFSNLKIVQASNLYDPNDHTTIVAEHGSEHVFDAKAEKQLTILQSVKWKGSYALGFSYLAMFPVAQSAVDKIYTDNGFIPSTPVNGYYGYVTKAEYYSQNNGISAEFGISKYPSNNSAYNKSFSTQDNGGTNYYKGYFVVCGTDLSVTNNTLWQSITTYNIEG